MSDLAHMKKVLADTAAREMGKAQDWLRAGNGTEARRCYKYADRIMRGLTVIEEAEHWWAFKNQKP